MNNRSEALAKRLEEGAEALADFAATLSENEWQMWVPHDGRGRPGDSSSEEPPSTAFGRPVRAETVTRTCSAGAATKHLGRALWCAK
jgi:hypothetical protein